MDFNCDLICIITFYNFYPLLIYIDHIIINNIIIGTSIDDNLAESLNNVLKLNAQNRLRKGKPCLEHCLRAFVTTLKKVDPFFVESIAKRFMKELFLDNKYW